MLWVAAAFVGSGLLFAVQPMIAKMVLPHLGGAPAVWTVSVLFFQTVLLAGYGYAHGLGRLAPRRQVVLHAALLLLTMGLLPFRPIEGASLAASFAPALWLLEKLLLTVGLPFLVLSAGAPLFQRWLSWMRLEDSSDPYFLYAASNAGSLLALGAYPLLIEPSLGLERQRDFWAWGFAGYLLLALGCAARAWNARGATVAVPRSRHYEEDGAQPSFWRSCLWIALAAAPSSLMLGVTSILTTDVAPMPLLWVLPLSLYLLSFVLAFSRRAILPPDLWTRILPIAAVVFLLLWTTKATEPLAIVLPSHLAVFFTAAMACHTELARLRPPARHLTWYYSLIGLGGWIGGSFNTLLAPALFEDWIEAPVAFVLACLIVPRRRLEAGDKRRKSRAPGIRRSDLLIPAALGTVTFSLVQLADVSGASGEARQLLVAGIPALLIYLASERRIRFGLTAGAVLFAASQDTALRGRPELTDRTLFGIHRVTRAEAIENGHPVVFHQLYHGTTIHGVQRVERGTGLPGGAREALAYYSRTSPIGRLFLSFRGGAFPRRVGLVGLGAGSLLAYAEAGQRWMLFEIDPLVKRIAEDARFFSYLPEARKRGVEAEVVLADARLSLGSAEGTFDLLVLDAFTSGSIPTHLLTREAFELYGEKLEPNGLLAVHISNRHLDLAPLIRAAANDLRLTAVIEEDLAGSPSSRPPQTLGSLWAFVARSPESLWSRGLRASEPLTASVRPRVWTDDHSDLWSLFRW